MISRAGQSKILDSVTEELYKEASFIERICTTHREDPFEGQVDGDVWHIVKGKLVRNNKKGMAVEKK